jgi:RNA polymerase sigma factor (sigma-70 family)
VTERSPRRGPPALTELVERHRPLVVRWLARHAGGLVRFEDPEDLAQWVATCALEGAARYEHRGEREFVGWILVLARQVVADRNAYWHALKRDAGAVVRLTAGGGAEPKVRATGPSTSASRREMLERAVRALDVLGARDAELVRMHVNDVPIPETAERFGVSYEAAQRARLRAIERLRKVYALAAGKRARK